jgi:alpha-tubulin suppressor-like RCC1 family protein
MTNSSVPTLVAGALQFAALSTGSAHTCAVTTTGVAYCWGYNADGELGIGTRNDFAMPAKVVGQL